VILVVVVALTAIGILMVYSSSRSRATCRRTPTPSRPVGPQILWAILGIVRWR
jgi:cell division protein FtsW (lipid II flippase)